MAKSIEIDRKKRLRDEPHKGHNRWHPDIAPVIEAAPGEEVTLETRDANDLQIGPRTTVKDLEKLERTVAHPLTGPVYVKGAKPGDLLGPYFNNPAHEFYRVDSIVDPDDKEIRQVMLRAAGQEMQSRYQVRLLQENHFRMKPDGVSSILFADFFRLQIPAQMPSTTRNGVPAGPS